MSGERIRFQADADFDMTIVRGLRRRQPAIDIQSTDDAGLRGVPDLDVLAFCAQQDVFSSATTNERCRRISPPLWQTVAKALVYFSSISPFR